MNDGLTTRLRKNTFVVNLFPKPRTYCKINGNSTGYWNGKNTKIKIGTWNIRTLYKPVGTPKNIISEIAKYNIHFFVLKETTEKNRKMTSLKLYT